MPPKRRNRFGKGVSNLPTSPESTARGRELLGKDGATPRHSVPMGWGLVGLLGMIGLVVGIVWISGRPTNDSPAASDRGAEQSPTSSESRDDTATPTVTLRLARQWQAGGELMRAEQGYRELLSRDPQSVAVQRELAKLLGTCGRRLDAIPLVLQLIATGNADDLVLLLARENGVIADLDLLRRSAARNPPDPLGLVGLAWHAADEGRHDEAVTLLRKALDTAPDLDVAHGNLGMQLVTQGEFTSIPAWNANLPSTAERLPTVWLVRGAWAEEAGQRRAAIRCYLEAAKRSPDSKAAFARLIPLLAQEGERQLAEKCRIFSERLRLLTELQDRVFFASEPSGVETLLELIGRYEEVGRFWEAFAFVQLAIEIEPTRSEVQAAFRRLRVRVSNQSWNLFDATMIPLAGFPLESYPRPRWESLETSPYPNTGDKPGRSGAIPRRFVFRNDQSTLGFTYFNGNRESQRRMYEFTGGGIGVLDFDLDGWPDVFFSQGCHWPPGGTDAGQPRDELLRNLEGIAFQPAGRAVIETVVGFGQGVSVGDIDADGFPDLYVANAGGQNRLYRNQGDGTFEEVSIATGARDDRWTTSCAIADLNGDGLADLYDVNYVQGEDVFQRVCTDDMGHPAICMPFDFDGAEDVVWINDGRGSFVDRTSSFLLSPANGKGLGIVVADLTGEGVLGAFVANDTTANHLWIPYRRDEQGKELCWEDRAAISGIALNGEGKAEGSMGIAVADLDTNGQLDLLVTNFLYESNTLYMGRGKGVYEDTTRKLGLHDPSQNVLGFGTQFMDIDLDGHLELMVANGHIDDLVRKGRPYRMPTQLFQFDSVGKFQLVNEADLVGPYFRENWLGRAVAKWDWNRDGRIDALVGHLYDPTVLLTNQTPNHGHFLSIQLVGVQSNRDAIGTEVRVRVGERRLVQQLIAGDGYQCSNQRRLLFGLGQSTSITEIEVFWPSGRREVFPGGEVDRERLFVEGTGEPLGSLP